MDISLFLMPIELFSENDSIGIKNNEKVLISMVFYAILMNFSTEFSPSRKLQLSQPKSLLKTSSCLVERFHCSNSRSLSEM